MSAGEDKAAPAAITLIEAITQALAEVGQVKRLVRHDGNAPCCQLAASVRFTAAVILSTLGRYFISSRNSGMWVS